jgi:cyanophycinase
LPALVEPGLTRGVIMPIGGAEDKLRDPRVLKRFLSVCGARPRICVIPTASGRKDIGAEYSKLFLELGAGAVDVLAISEREHCFDEQLISALKLADGVFMTGGKQMRLSTTLGGTPVAKLLRKMNASGTPIAGTSAGAAILPEHMIASGDEGATPREGMVSLAPGLGFTNKVMVDQHFRQRDRIGRLMTALAYNPFAIGLGVDEDTAALIDAHNSIEVVGSGAVTVVDPSQLTHTTIDEADRGQPIAMLNLRVHVLIEGARFDLERRAAMLG